VQLLELIGRGLAHYLSKPGKDEGRGASCEPGQLSTALRKGDVLLVEGFTRFSTAIKYLTQSTWSHAALCISNEPGKELLEADVLAGVRVVPLSDYWTLHTRICRPVGLTEQEIDAVIAYATGRLGHQYDLKNIIDLARYLIRTPPVPSHWRRRMLALGSGDPTKAICSSLIAQAFQSVRYPILPERSYAPSDDPNCDDCYDEFLHIRHHSLFAPRDFDISPYFRIVKPALKHDFDPHKLTWGDDLV
jgi:hypothetical protein